MDDSHKEHKDYSHHAIFALRKDTGPIGRDQTQMLEQLRGLVARMPRCSKREGKKDKRQAMMTLTCIILAQFVQNFWVNLATRHHEPSNIILCYKLLFTVIIVGYSQFGWPLFTSSCSIIPLCTFINHYSLSRLLFIIPYPLFRL